MNRKNAVVDLLKFYFACMIVLFHGSQNLGAGIKTFTSARIAVEFFFLVSGYLMAASARRYSDRLAEGGTNVWRLTGDYLRHKLARLTPNVFIAWFVAAAVVIGAEQYHGYELLKKLTSGFFEFTLIKTAGYSDIFAPNGVTWYLSAMLLSMALLFPFLVAKRECFLRWFAPLAAIFLYGYLNVAWSNGLAGSAEWSGITTKGIYRALAALCLGCTCFALGERLRTLEPRPACRVLASLIGVLCFVWVSYVAWAKKNSNYDYVLVVITALMITVSFSGIGFSGRLSGLAPVSRVSSFLGELSMNLFLSNGYWCHYLPHYLPGFEGKRLFAAYLAVCLINALILMLVSRLLKKAWPALSVRLRRFVGAGDERST